MGSSHPSNRAGNVTSTVPRPGTLRWSTVVLIICVFGGLAPASWGQSGGGSDTETVDLVHFVGGKVIEGKIVGETDREIRVLVKMGSIRAEVPYQRSEIERIERGVAVVRPAPKPAQKPARPVPDRAVETPTPAPVEHVAAPRAPRSERMSLMAAMSEEYYTGTQRVAHPHRIEDLAAFRDSKDPSVQRLVKSAIGIHLLFEITNRKRDFTLEAAKFYAELAEYALTSLDSPPSEALHEVGRIFGSRGGAVDRAAERLRSIMADSVEIQRSQNAMREAARAMLAAGAPGDLLGIEVRFETPSSPNGSVTPVTAGFAVVTNRTKEPLHDLAIVTDVRMNRARIEKMWEAEYAHWVQARAMEALLGVDEASWQKRVEARRLRAERAKLGYGGVVYVERIPAGSSVRVLLGPLGDIDQIAETVTVSCFAEGVGATRMDLDVEAMRETIMRVVKAQEVKPTPPPTQPRRTPPRRR